MTEAPTNSDRRGSRRDALAAFAGFVLLSILFTWPLATAPFSHVIGHAEREGVPPLNTWAMATVWRNLFAHPGALLQGSAFYPYDNSVAFSEHLLVPALMAGPIAVATGSWTFAYNASVLTALVLSAFFMFLLARELGASRAGALLGGGLYAFNTWNINEIVRLQILSNEFFPLALWACVRFAARPTWPRALAVSGAALLQALSCMYWAVYLPFLLIPVLVALLGMRVRAFFKVCVALLGAASLVLAIAWPYVSNGRAFGYERAEPESVPLDRYFQVRPENLLYGAVLPHGLANQNAAHFQGFLALILCVPGAFLLWRRRPRLAVALLGLGLFSLVASLGPEIWLAGRRLGPGLYGWLFENLPAFRQIRYPERFAIFVNLTVAVLAALGLGALDSRSRRFAWAVAFGALGEHLSMPQFLDQMPPLSQSQDVYSAVRELPEGAVVAEVPATRYRMERRDAVLMFQSIGHEKRTVEGFTGYFPPLYSLAKWHLFNFPSARSLKFLSDLGVTTIIDRSNQPLPPEVFLLGSFGDARLLRLPSRAPGSFMDDSFHSRPEWNEIARDGWDIRLPERDADPMALRDDDPRTTWSTVEGQTRAAFLRVRFKAPERLGRIRLFLPLPAEFPIRFRVEGLVDTEERSPVLAHDADWAFTSLARSLWKTPRTAFMDIDLDPVLVSGFRIRVIEDDPFRLPITISEVRAYRAPLAAGAGPEGARKLLRSARAARLSGPSGPGGPSE